MADKNAIDIRITRIHIHAIVRLCITKLQDPRDESLDAIWRQSQLEESTRTVFEMQQDIMASVPQHLGKISSDGKPVFHTQRPLFNFQWQAFKARSYNPQALLFPECDGTPVMRAFGGSALGWALFAAAKVRGTDAAVYNKIRRLLRMVGMPQGNHQANIFAELLHQQEGWY